LCPNLLASKSKSNAPSFFGVFTSGWRPVATKIPNPYALIFSDLAIFFQAAQALDPHSGND